MPTKDMAVNAIPLLRYILQSPIKKFTCLINLHVDPSFGRLNPERANPLNLY
jgi:hypothetical protein